MKYLHHFDSIDKENAKQHQDQQHNQDWKRKNQIDLTIEHDQLAFVQLKHQAVLDVFFLGLVQVDSKHHRQQQSKNLFY